MQEEVCYLIDFDIACPGDTHFYQACGHGGCAGYEVGEKKIKFLVENVCELSFEQVNCGGSEGSSYFFFNRHFFFLHREKSPHGG